MKNAKKCVFFEGIKDKVSAESPPTISRAPHEAGKGGKPEVRPASKFSVVFTLPSGAKAE